MFIIIPKMLLRSPALRFLPSLSKRLTQSFSSDPYKMFLDPTKHVAMNYVSRTNSLYQNLYPVGTYPELYIYGSLPANTYQSQVQKIVIEALNSKFNASLNFENAQNRKFNQLIQNDLKAQYTQNDILQYLNQTLAKKIFVRESGWTWVFEQKLRQQLSQQLMRSHEINSLHDYVLSYNHVIDHLISLSHFGISPNIQHEKTAQQKHLEQQILEQRQERGIPDLKNEKQQYNKNFINRMMSRIHSF